jgi:thiol-disulfide isomerase/thioredoxin
MTTPDDPHTPADAITAEELDRLEATEADQRRRRILLALGGAFIAVLVVVVAVQWAVDTPDDTVLPEFELTTLDGQPFALRSVVGTPTVLNFFATWCPPCRTELPAFEAVSREVGDDVAFLGINTRETDVEGVRALLDETGVTFPVALGDDGDLFEMIGGLGMPTTVFVDADGTVVEVHSGGLDDDALRSKIETNFGR